MRSRPTDGSTLTLRPITPLSFDDQPDDGQPLDPAEIEKLLHLHGLLGRRVGRLLGMTTTWATTRWVAGPERRSVVPQFFVRVPGDCPTREVGEVVTRRLARHGWAGRLIADDGIFRVDAEREGATIVLSAHDHTLTLTLRGAPVVLGSAQSRMLLAGVYEEAAAA